MDAPDPAGLPPEVARFGNHHRRFLRAIERGLPELRARLAASDPPLAPDRPFVDPVVELQRVRDVSGGPAGGGPALQAMAAWYAWQFLHLNGEAVRRLSAGTEPDTAARFADAMGLVRRRFSALSQAFVGHVIDHHAAGRPLPPFALAFVGAQTDHEDIDIAVIAGGAPDPSFSTVLARAQTSCFRHGHTLHPHLSRYVRGNRIWATVAEYREILDRDLKDVVLASQVVGSGFLVGDRGLYDRFRVEVYRRYFARGSETPHHEGFLRGAIAELRTLLDAERDPGELHPKAEVYRPVKLLLAAARTVLDVEGTGVVPGFAALAGADPEHAGQYATLSQAYVFNEVLRYLYALHVVQEVAIPLHDEAVRRGLDEVAGLMGLPGADALVAAYDDNLRAAADAGRGLLEVLAGHLRGISALHRAWAAGRFSEAERPAAMVLELARGLGDRVFRDDVVDLLLEQPALLEDVAADLLAGDVGALTDWVETLAGELPSLVRLLATLLDRPEGDPGRALAAALLEATVRSLPGSRERLDAWVDLSYSHPRLLHGLLRAAGPGPVRELLAVLARPTGDPRVLGALRRHQALRALAFGHSRYVGRFVDRVLAAHPGLVEVIDDLHRSRALARRLLTGRRRGRDPATRLAVAGEYYDLEYVRTAVHTLLGEDADTIEREFLASSDLYVQAQLAACAARVLGDDAPEDPLAGLPDFALLATGGNARGEAFHDDYDYVALVDTADAGHAARCEAVVRCAHAGILRRALVPHNRSSERFGTYVVALADLEAWLAEDRDDLFIDQSELLDSRLVAGDPSLAWRLANRVLAPLVFGRREAYVARLVAELEARRAAAETAGSPGIHPKEGPGGLREVVLLLLALKATWGVREPLIRRAFPRLRARADHEETARLLGELEGHYRFVKRLRDVWRLAVAYDETVDPAGLGELPEAAAVPELGDDPGELEARLRAEMAAAGEAVDRVLEIEGLRSARVTPPDPPSDA